jgi:hypothetical protein
MMTVWPSFALIAVNELLMGQVRRAADAGGPMAGSGDHQGALVRYGP